MTLIVLLILTILIFFKLFQVLGKEEYGYPEGMQEEYMVEHRPQWQMLSSLDSSLSESRLVVEFIDIFKKIHKAFCDCSIHSIENYLSDSVRISIEKSLKERGKYKFDCRFIEEPECVIKQISIVDKVCTVDAAFTSQQVVQIINGHGNVVDNPHEIAEDVTDYWIFEKNFGFPKSFWILTHMS